MVTRLGIIVQAHMGSTRLPGKMLKSLCGKTVLGHVISRLKMVNNADELIVATSDLKDDDLIVKECNKYSVNIFRGSNDDVLSRFYNAALKYELTDIVRVCADNTLVDWELLQREIDEYKKDDASVVIPGENVPLGLGGEIFSFQMLREAFMNGKEHYHREHVTPYIYERYKKIIKVDYNDNYRNYRLTLDTKEDWMLIEKIYKHLYNGMSCISFRQVAELLIEHPSWVDINKNIRQKGVKD